MIREAVTVGVTLTEDQLIQTALETALPIFRVQLFTYRETKEL
jgi:hypothetical protein